MSSQEQFFFKTTYFMGEVNAILFNELSIDYGGIRRLGRNAPCADLQHPGSLIIGWFSSQSSEVANETPANCELMWIAMNMYWYDTIPRGHAAVKIPESQQSQYWEVAMFVVTFQGSSPRIDGPSMAHSH